MRTVPLLLLMACATPPPPGAGLDTARADSSTPPLDSAPDEEADDTDLPPADSTPPDTAPPAVDEVCYPGPDQDGTACFPVVQPRAPGPDYAYPSASSAAYRPPVRYLDLEAIDLTRAIAPNFVADELLQAWKGRFGVLAPELVSRLQAVRTALGGPVLVNSGYRSPGYNASVGGVERSRHMFGDAADIRSSVATLAAVGAACEAEGADYVGYYESHVHCDWRNAPLHPAFFDPASSVRPEPVPPPQHAAVLVPGVAWSAPAWGWDEGEPLRTWRAHAADGTLLAERTARRFVPPPQTARVTVEVGRRIVLTHPVP